MTPQELKASILKAAIEGKLTKQYPNETPVAGVKRISSEIEPYEIPENWIWCQLDEIATLHNGRAYKKLEMLEKGKYPLLRVGNLFTSEKWYYSDLELEPEKYCDKGDLLYAWSASFGPHIWQGDRVIYHYHIWKVELRFPDMRDYLFWALEAQTESLKRQGHGSTMIHITKAGTEKMLIPLPPLAEQKRIVAKIEELLPYIERYEQAWSKLEDFNKRFPVDMQKSILQMAIQGKLVEQCPEEGTGEELYQQIQEEKQKLIKAGKIKKEKPLPEISEDEIPFEIPESWKWVRVGAAFVTSSGTTPARSRLDYYDKEECNWVRTTDLNNGVLASCEIRISEKAKEECRLEIIPRQSVCLAMYGGAGTIGKNALIDFDTTINQSVCAIHPNGLCDMRYVQLYMQYHRPNWMKSAAGSRKDPNINQIIIKNAIIPLPPLDEQKRIVAKLEEILPLCEWLK